MAAGDLTDLPTVKAVANITTSTSANDLVLSLLITAISAFVPNQINRQILAANYVENYRGNGKDRLLLRQRPVLAISAVVWQGQSAITTPGDAFAGTTGVTTDGRSAILVNYTIPRGADVRVSYAAGYSTVPADLSLAVAELVAEEYARRTRIGESSRSQGGQTTASFDQKAMGASIMVKLKNYIHGAPVYCFAPRSISRVRKPRSTGSRRKLSRRSRRRSARLRSIFNTILSPTSCRVKFSSTARAR